MIYAQILNKVVVNTIVIDDENVIPHFKNEFEFFERVDHLIPQPGIGTYHHNGQFTKIIIDEIDELASVPSGSEIAFIPFQFSEMSGGWHVSIEDELLRVGCHFYDYKWIRYALYKILTQGVSKVGCLLKTNYGVSYGNIFNIKQEDIDMLYRHLCSLR